ncbi:MAG: DUF4423 domain-containing protein, partial [Pseudobdellovibrionaceae bacterium]
EQLKLAIYRLNRLGYLEIKNKKWILKSPSLTWTNNTQTSEARKLLQKQNSLMSHLAIDEIDFNKRDHSSLSVAIHPDLIPELKQRITRFRRALDRFVTQHSAQPEEVYHFTFSFYPVSHPAPRK